MAYLVGSVSLFSIVSDGSEYVHRKDRMSAREKERETFDQQCINKNAIVVIGRAHLISAINKIQLFYGYSMKMC